MARSLKRKRDLGEASHKAKRIHKAGEIDASDNDTEVELDDRVESGHESESSTGDKDAEVEGEWGGLDGVEDQTTSRGTKPKKPPTGEELRNIKDATDLFMSSSFKLQIDALLPNVRPKASKIPPLERLLFLLHGLLMDIPPVAPQHPLEGSRRLLKKGVSVPYSAPLPTEETKWKVAFEKPSDITLVGSWPLKTSVKSKDGIGFAIDIAVEMPDSLFQEKDYLNGRFFQKRAFYLATIAAALDNPKKALGLKVSYDSLSDDPRLTKVVLIPTKGGPNGEYDKLNAQICIIPVLSLQSPIPIHRLSPSHSNIRAVSPANDETKNPPTPIYNTALLLAVTPKTQLLTTHALKEVAPSFTDALTLLRVWANQRGYGPGSRVCVRGFEARGSWWTALLELLIHGEERTGSSKSSTRKPSGRGLSSYQLFRAALYFLSKHKFHEDPIFVKTKDGAHRYPPEEYREHHEVTFVDSSSTINLLAGIPLGSLELLRHDAKKTLETLDQASISADPFADVFLTDHRDLSTRFDSVIRVDLSSAKPLNPSLYANLDLGSPANALLASLSSVLQHGLGNRTKSVSILSSPSSPRPLSQAHPSSSSIVYIGLLHNPSDAYRLVDYGPAADEEDATKIQKFRDFWGDKAELRRFKDGRITESVVWDVKTADERAHIPTMIVQHILRRHFSLESGAVQTWQTPFDSLLRLPETISSMYISSGVSTGFKGAVTAFDDLVKQIKALDNALPLAVMNISPASEQLRYTSVFSPTPLPSSLAATMPATARHLTPINVILEFEKSSRWPDDLKAIQKMKLAFCERIATELMSSNGDLRAAVVVGDGIQTSEILDKAYLEIITAEGWAFAIRICNDREAILLDRIIDEYNKPVPPALKAQLNAQKNGREYHDAVEAKEVYTRRFIHAPRHHRAIAALCHQYSAFAGTVRLVKRWLSAHWLLHGHISEEAVELICAALFVGDGRGIGVDSDDDAKHNERESVPGSKERGFATVVAFLRGWNWEDGLFVPLYGSDKSSKDGISKPSPKAMSGGVWNLSTGFDEGGRMWTSYGPDVVIAHRVKALAKATWNHLQGMELGEFNVKGMFIHPTSDYDIVISLNASLLPRYLHNVSVDTELLNRRGKYANLPENQVATVQPGYDPARLLFCDLQRVYTDTFKIFHDTFGGDRFGIVWDPSLKEPRPFRVLGGFSSTPAKKDNERIKEKGLVILNEGSILSEIERLGTGLIKEITVCV